MPQSTVENPPSRLETTLYHSPVSWCLPAQRIHKAVVDQRQPSLGTPMTLGFEGVFRPVSEKNKPSSSMVGYQAPSMPLIVRGSDVSSSSLKISKSSLVGVRQ